MKPGSVVLAMILGVAAFVGTVWVGKYLEKSPNSRLTPAAPVKSEPLPQVGPPAKAVVDNMVHDFDSMERHSKGEHVFTIRNEGEGTLLLEKGTATCKCTKFHLGESDDVKKMELPPGKSINVTVAWKVEGTSPTFHQDATVRTNDPTQPELTFRIKGKVVYVLFVRPERRLMAPDVVAGTPTQAVGVVGSRLLKDFEIISLDSSSEFMTATSTRLEEKDLKALDAKVAYRIDATIQPNIPIGRFTGFITVKGVGEGRTFEEKIEVSTNRIGPIKIVGAQFNEKTMTLNMGDFSIADGKRADLSMFVKSAGDEEIEFHVVESTNEQIKLTIERDEKFQGGLKNRFRLRFEVPAGALTEPNGKGRVEFQVETNHPKLKSLKFRAMYQAY